MNHFAPSRPAGSHPGEGSGSPLPRKDLGEHDVQFYEAEPHLVETFRRLVSDALRDGDALIAISSAAHREAMRGGIDRGALDRAVAEGRIKLLDARATLDRVIVNGQPDPLRFQETIERLITDVAERHPRARVRGYDEMVDILWRGGNPAAAIRLEELWNTARGRRPFSLLCAYGMENFRRKGDTSPFLEVCHSHDRIIPTEPPREPNDARTREISLLQRRTRVLEDEIHQRQALEAALRDALRAQSRVEDELRAWVRRETEARARAEASDAFKEMFLSILGHDLRNPLNTVLTTARLMRMQHDLPSEADNRLDRIVHAGSRMERMIGQLLDVARARLDDGIPVSRTESHDLRALVVKKIEETRAAHPQAKISVEADAVCPAFVDADRLQQVVSNLVDNAVIHGDLGQPVTVRLTVRDGAATLAVHNFGLPIAPEALPTLFDPFATVSRSRGQVDRLGLGLYIVERIVRAHGGDIRVDSSANGGTRFEVTLPLLARA